MWLPRRLCEYILGGLSDLHSVAKRHVTGRVQAKGGKKASSRYIRVRNMSRLGCKKPETNMKSYPELVKGWYVARHKQKVACERDQPQLINDIETKNIYVWNYVTPAGQMCGNEQGLNKMLGTKSCSWFSSGKHKYIYVGDAFR